MHHLASLLSKFSLQVKISYQNVSCCTRKRPCFHVFIFFLQFSIVSNTVTMHALDVHCFHLFLCSSKSFQILPECMLQRQCFQNVLCSSKIVLNTVRMHALETLFSKKISVVPKRLFHNILYFFVLSNAAHTKSFKKCLKMVSNVAAAIQDINFFRGTPLE